jgi:hypothetical protein
MTILTSTGREVYDYPYAHDKDESKYYYFKHKPATWDADTVYLKAVDIVIPTPSTGFMWECKSSGRSDALVEPIAPTVENMSFDDGTVAWKTKPYNAILKPGDTITASTWESDNIDTLIDDFTLMGNYLVGFRLYGIVAGAEDVTITNILTVTLASGNKQVYNRSMRIPIKEL